jgi:L-cysteine/cystine lyase
LATMPAPAAVDPKVAALRAALPSVETTAYFNVGSNGPIPRVAQVALLEAATAELEVGRIVPGLYERNRGRNREIAALIAEMFDADTDEIALTHSTTEGLATVLMGMTWQRGDEVVTCPLEHPGLLSPLGLLAHRYGVVLRHAEVGVGDGDVVGAIAGAITTRTRVIALSHVMWSTGAVLPLRELADLARERGVLLVVDGAQSAGQIPVALHALGVDAYAMAGQKWLCGPEATGALYVRRDRFADIAPTYLRYAQFDPSGYILPAPSAQRYEIGEFYGPGLLAFAAGLRWLRDEVGLDWAYARTAELGQRVHAGLSALDGVTVVTPAARMAGLVNFAVAGMRPQEVAARLFERNITIRYVDVRPCPVTARAAAAWWNTEEEVDQLVAAAGEIAAG